MKSFLEQLAYWPAIGFGLGKVPVAPGTFGSLLGPPLVWGVFSLPLPIAVSWSIAACLILLGGPICAVGATKLNQKDPGAVVYDEYIAFFIVFALVPVNLVTSVIGFFTFRLFDIAKPWPVNTAEKLPGGWGILTDDLVAGVYSAAVLTPLWWWVLPEIFPGG